MSSVNKVILIGRLGKDPETRQFQNGGSVTNLSIATSERWTDKNTGERKEQTEWHKTICHNRLAEIAGQYLSKGSLVYIEGSIHTRKWQDQQGIERYSTEISVKELRMLDSKGNNQNQSPQQGYQQQGGYTPQNNQPPRQYPQGMTASPDMAMQRLPQNTYQNSVPNDDIPF